ncbi:hypothetical protein PoB_000981600 [Plakobranchus ocellatus]|uniref:Uncharacterized protein n=1 Tax=Plakobranchus ocellatus TaxID=259542 RepID=A0AAV3YJ86_9GAST|nr:hypothetical protein PoB_000981600 [Plakobranchus ocellatus]
MWRGKSRRPSLIGCFTSPTGQAALQLLYRLAANRSGFCSDQLTCPGIRRGFLSPVRIQHWPPGLSRARQLRERTTLGLRLKDINNVSR